MLGLFFVIFCAGLIIGNGVKLVYESSLFKPYEWREKPIVINCYGPEFSELQFMRAVEFWSIRSNDIAFYEHNPPEEVCQIKSDIEGMIVIRKKARGWKDGTLALTTRRSIGISIISATIMYSPGSFNLDLLNEHELGHAFGFNHLEVDNHIMHPNYRKMGTSFWVP